MAQVQIKIVRSDLEGMGIEAPDVYTNLVFKDCLFEGYWCEPTSNEITFYVGTRDFMCDSSPRVIKLFNELCLKD